MFKRLKLCWHRWRWRTGRSTYNPDLPVGRVYVVPLGTQLDGTGPLSDAWIEVGYLTDDGLQYSDEQSESHKRPEVSP